MQNLSYLSLAICITAWVLGFEISLKLTSQLQATLQHAECRVVPEVLETTSDIECIYNDIIYFNDDKYEIGPDKVVKGSAVYRLRESDHVKIKCTGNHANR